MALVGMVIPGRQSTTPTVPRVGRTGMAAQVSLPGGSTRQSSPAVPWRDDRSPSVQTNLLVIVGYLRNIVQPRRYRTHRQTL